MPDPADRICAECGGAGYLVEQVLGQAARARRCTCQAACPRCGETGYTLVPQGSSMVAQVCSCRHLDERIGLFNQIGVPAAIAKASFETFRCYAQPHANANQVAQDFARKFRKDAPTQGFLFFGRPGAGKTHLLVATLRYLALEKGVSGRYVEFMLLLSEIRAGFSANRSHMDILKPLLAVPVLAIDELVSRRYNSGLSTLFATNYFPEEQAPRPREAPGRVVRTSSPEFQREAEAMTLQQRVGDRIYSRLVEMCAFVKLDPGHDHRKDAQGSGYWQRS